MNLIKFKISFFLLLSILLIITNFNYVYSKCVMYEPCHHKQDDTGFKWLNCRQEKEAQPFTEKTHTDKFRELCPMVYNSDNDNVCCSYNQLLNLEKDIEKADSLLDTCKPCSINFRTLWCTMACHPNQAEFLQVLSATELNYHNYTEIENKPNEDYNEDTNIDDKEVNYDETKNDDSDDQNTKNADNDSNGINKTMVTKLRYYINQGFVDGLIDSCKDIKMGGGDALTAFCSISSRFCTSQRLTVSLGLIVTARPFDIEFSFTETNSSHYNSNKSQLFKPVIPIALKCNQDHHLKTNKTIPKCGCTICRDSCPADLNLNIKQKSSTFFIGKYDGAYIVMFGFFLIFTIVFITTLVCHRIIINKKKSYLTSLRSTTDGTNVNGDKDANCFNLNDIYCLDKLQNVGERFEHMIHKSFSKLGKYCSLHPKTVLITGFVFCMLLCLGFVHFKIEKDPIELWSAESSVARKNKKYFDDNFGAFYRITQLIIVAKQDLRSYHEIAKINTTFGNAWSSAVLLESFELYERIRNLVSNCEECNDGNGKDVALEDICFKPMEPENKHCAIQSIFEYYKNSNTSIRHSIKLNSTKHTEKLLSCAENPLQHDCLSTYGAPIQPFMVLGGYNDSKYAESNALVITFVINNNKKDPEALRQTMSWEASALNILKNYKNPVIDVFFTTERSIEDEIDRESKADIKIIIISYLAMFLYLTLTLGKYSSFNMKVMLVETKMFLALTGVVIVIFSVVSSAGFFQNIDVPATLITLEVIPFLLLAVGVDNIYVMVQTYQNDERGVDEPIEKQISRIVGKVGPSMLLSGVTQSIAFLLSAMTPMPGVRAFSLYASLAIILNFCLQITCFVVLLTLDAKREKSKRLDIICFVKLDVDDSDIYQEKKSFLFRFFKNYYTKLLFNDFVRPIVMIIFMGFFFACIAMCDKIKIGFDQRLAMPTDSYQIKYFDALENYLSVGPPVYFVVRNGFNYTNEHEIKKLCGSANCNENSLQTIITKASQKPNESFIAEASFNWIDDFNQWIEIGECCSLYDNTHHRSNQFCDSRTEHNFTACRKCPVTYYNSLSNKNDTFSEQQLPDGETLNKYVKYFLKQTPYDKCTKAGHALYGNAIKLNEYYGASTRNRTRNFIGASHFMAYHTVLSNSDDFINAMQAAQMISDNIQDMLNANRTGDTKYEVFPYSIFYVFYEQYFTIWKDATMQLLLTLAAIFVCTFILLSFDLFTAFIITCVIAIIIIDMVGIMYLWNIELNAVSLVNLVIAIGISVEFSAHISRAFATSEAVSRKERAAEALYTMGPPVFSGILQSIVGISVLAFANSQLFQVFYFRMYFSILILGMTHGLIFLPVLLSYVGRRSSRVKYSQLDSNENDRRQTASNDGQIINNDASLTNCSNSLENEFTICPTRIQTTSLDSKYLNINNDEHTRLMNDNSESNSNSSFTNNNSNSSKQRNTSNLSLNEKEFELKLINQTVENEKQQQQQVPEDQQNHKINNKNKNHELNRHTSLDSNNNNVKNSSNDVNSNSLLKKVKKKLSTSSINRSHKHVNGDTHNNNIDNINHINNNNNSTIKSNNDDYYENDDDELYDDLGGYDDHILSQSLTQHNGHNMFSIRNSLVIPTSSTNLNHTNNSEANINSLNKQKRNRNTSTSSSKSHPAHMPTIN